MVVTWRNSYSPQEIIEMRCELVALHRKLFIEDNWRYTDKIRFDNLRTCLGLLGFWYQGGNFFELTNGTDLL